MKIYTVIAELGAGGAEVVAVTIARAAAAEGHDVTLASSRGHRVADLRNVGVSHLPLTLAGRRPLDLVRSVRTLRAAGRPDLVHAHNPKATLVARLAFGSHVPLLTTLHGVPEAELRRTAGILNWASAHIVVVTPHLKRMLVDAGVPAAHVEVVPNAVEPLPSYDRARARAELDLAPEGVVGLCLARLVDQKRHDLLVHAWRHLRDRPLLLVAGDGPNRPGIEAAIECHGLGDAVRVLGARSDVARLVAASDFLVLPTDWEGLPISVLEALAAGLPVVASRVGDLADHFAGAVVLAEPGSSVSLAAALDLVIGSPELRADLADRGRALAASRFCVDTMVARYRRLYQHISGFADAPSTPQEVLDEPMERSTTAVVAPLRRSHPHRRRRGDRILLDDRRNQWKRREWTG